VETSPPLPPQQQAPQPPPPLPPQEGTGCFAKGCLVVVIVGILLIGAFGVGAWFLFGRAVSVFTSPQPADVRIEQVADVDLRNAEQKLNRLGQAAADNQEATIEFTANELNAMIAREPLFAELNNHARVAIADSTLTLEVSAPLEQMRLPKLQGRWFNGTARVGFSFGNDEFLFELKSGEANGRPLPQKFFIGVAPTFNRSLNQAFHKELEKNNQAAIFWKHIKIITLNGDKLVVVTQRL
jgi:hypothetical protein